MRDARDYPRLKARCATASNRTVLTSVEHFQTDDHATVEIVADALLLPPSDGLSEYESPSVTIYDTNCRKIWFKSYPELGEAAFQPMKIPGGRLVYVAAVSIFHPVDGTVFEGELLSVHGSTVTSEVSFGGFRDDMVYLGPLGRSDSFGVVVIHDDNPLKMGFEAVSPAITATVHRWRASHFAAPEKIGAPALHAMKLHLTGSLPPFPLFRFVFGMRDPG